MAFLRVNTCGIYNEKVNVQSVIVMNQSLAMDVKIWDEILVRQLASNKSKKRYSDLILTLQFNEFQSTLDNLRRQYQSAKVDSCLDRVSSVIAHVQSFQQAIGTIVQITPQIAGVIWESLGLIFEVSFLLGLKLHCKPSEDY